MVTVRAFINGSVRYYKCDNIACAEALLDVLARAHVEASFL